MDLRQHSKILVHQKHELAEWFGFETRNSYHILDAHQHPIGYAAEQGSKVKDLIMRQILGHWRRFTVQFFTADRRPFMRAHHPFRWYFQRLEVSGADDRPLGVIEKRFSIFSKSFHVLGADGQILMEVSSPIWKIWSFPFSKNGREVAAIRKKWSGVFLESMTDKDKFLVEYTDPQLKDAERQLILAASLFIDLLYFEKKANSR